MRSIFIPVAALLALATLAVGPTDVCSEPAEAPAERQDAGRESGRVSIDASDAQRTYANFARVTGTPEDLVIDFGFNANPFGRPAEPIEIDERIVMNFYTAKRLSSALQLALDRHEKAFGPIETDVRKRVKKQD